MRKTWTAYSLKSLMRKVINSSEGTWLKSFHLDEAAEGFTAVTGFTSFCLAGLTTLSLAGFSACFGFSGRTLPQLSRHSSTEAG